MNGKEGRRYHLVQQVSEEEERQALVGWGGWGSLSNCSGDADMSPDKPILYHHSQCHRYHDHTHVLPPHFFSQESTVHVEAEEKSKVTEAAPILHLHFVGN